MKRDRYINREGGRRRKENWIIKREVRVRVGACGGGRHIVDFAVRLTDHRVRLNDRHSPAHTICYWSTHAVLAFTTHTKPHSDKSFTAINLCSIQSLHLVKLYVSSVSINSVIYIHALVTIISNGFEKVKPVMGVITFYLLFRSFGI